MLGPSGRTPPSFLASFESSICFDLLLRQFDETSSSGLVGLFSLDYPAGVILSAVYFAIN